MIRFGLRIGQFFEKIFGSTFLWKFTRSINSIFKTTLPSWPKYGIKIAKTFKPVSYPGVHPDYIIFPSCASRVLASDQTGTSASEYLTKIATNVAETSIIEYPTCLIFWDFFIYVKSITVEFNLFKS